MASILSSKEDFQNAVDNCDSIGTIIDYFGLSRSGDMYSQVKKWASIHEISLPKYHRTTRTTPKTLTDKLVKGRACQSSVLGRQLVAAGIFKYECVICGLGHLWEDKLISLHLDHIDGDNSNNLLENLRLLCPNCHSQTETYGSKNRKDSITYRCQCGKRIVKGSKACREHQDRSHTVKIEWPPVEEVMSALQNKPYTVYGKELGVSDNAIRNYLIRNGVTPPQRPRGRVRKSDADGS